MSSTAHLNIANIQVFAEEAAAIDKVNGTYEANLKGDRTYYLWQSDFKTIPKGMSGNPENFVDGLIQAIPGLNTLRIPFNKNSFLPDGSLDPLFERFLHAAADRGLALVPLLADGGAQQYEGTSAQILTRLEGQIFSDVKIGWELMKSWMDRNPDVESSVYGWELLNEAATFKRAVEVATSSDKEAVEARAVTLYLKYMMELADLVSEGNTGKILIDAWGYAGNTETLSTTEINGQSAIQALQAGVGDRLVWSLHYYPGWMGTEEVTDAANIHSAWLEFIAPLGDDDIIFTEVNAKGYSTYNPFQPEQANTATALALDWLKDKNIGFGWFPGAQTGDSGLVTIEGDGDIRYLNQASLAAAMNGFSYAANAPGRSGGELVHPTTVKAQLRNQIGDPDYAQGQFDKVKFAAFGMGFGGNDTVVGNDNANNFLYGGSGNDLISGAANDDFLYGQDGDDFIVSGDGVDYCFGGVGNDTIIADDKFNTIFGGLGADHFAIKLASSDVIVDYSSSEGDTWSGPWGSRVLGYSREDINADGKLDLKVWFSGEGVVDFINQGSDAGVVSVFSGLVSSRSEADLREAILESLRIEQDLAESTFVTALIALEISTSLGSIDGTDSAEQIIGSESSNVISAGGGNDVVFGEGGFDTVNAGQGGDFVFGGIGEDVLYGESGDDLIFGGRQADQIAGGDGEDILSGDGGNDSIWGGKRSDYLDGGEGDDAIFGQDEDDFLAGGLGSDSLYGDTGHDFIAGGGGDDLLVDGSGSDTMEGGAGADVFALVADGAVDVISDFEVGVDRLDLSALGRFHTVEALGFSQTANGAELCVGGERVILIRADGRPLRLQDVDASDLGVTALPPPAANPPPDQRLTGSSGIDTLRGDGGRDTIVGMAGGDRISGMAGDDILLGGTVRPGWDAVAAQVYRLYHATLDRDPDAGGMLSWHGRLSSGERTVTEVAEGFVSSREFGRVYGALDNEAFVTLLYHNVLERDPDAAGLAYWTGLLDSEPHSRAAVVVGFSDSAEFRQASAVAALAHSSEGLSMAMSDDVFRLYQATLGRDPDDGGFLSWTGRMAEGWNYRDMVAGFVGSREFRETYGTATDAEFVTLLYRNVLHREPDAAGFATWTGHLAAGTRDRAKVVEAFAQSVEFTRASADPLRDWMRGRGIDDVLDGGSGDDVLVGGQFSDCFVFRADAPGHDRVIGFEAWDFVEFRGFKFADAAAVRVEMSQVGRNVVFAQGAVSVTFENTTLSAFGDDVFLF